MRFVCLAEKVSKRAWVGLECRALFVQSRLCETGLGRPAIPDSVVAYARAWDRVVAEWDAGRLDVLYPPNHMMPFMAMYKFNNWSKERGEAKQEALIGMSSGQKDASTKRASTWEDLV